MRQEKSSMHDFEGRPRGGPEHQKAPTVFAVFVVKADDATASADGKFLKQKHCANPAADLRVVVTKGGASASLRPFFRGVDYSAISPERE